MTGGLLHTVHRSGLIPTCTSYLVLRVCKEVKRYSVKETVTYKYIQVHVQNHLKPDLNLFTFWFGLPS